MCWKGGADDGGRLADPGILAVGPAAPVDDVLHQAGEWRDCIPA